MTHHSLLPQIQALTALDPLSMQRQILQIEDPFSVVPLLVEVFSAPLSIQQKQTAAAAINLIHRNALLAKHEQWPRWWQQFQQSVLFQAGLIEWRFLSILSKSAQEMMNQFGVQFCDILNPIFDRLNFKAKLLLYQSFLYVDLTRGTMFIYLRETVEAFLRDTLGFLSWLHDRTEASPDEIILEKDALQTLYLLLSNLQGLYKDQYVDKLMPSLSLNHDLFCIIVEELLFDPSKTDYISIQKKQFNPERLNQLVFISQAKQPSLRQTVNCNKATAIRIFITILGRFDKKSMVEEFDHFKQLYFMEKISPLIVEELIRTIKSQEINDRVEVVVIALMDLLAYITEFNFQLQFFEQLYQKLLFEVCYPLLAPDLQQIESFREDGQFFIRLTEEMVQHPQGKAMSLRNAASELLQSLIQALNGSLTSLVDLNVRAIRSLLTKDSDNSFRLIQEDFGLEVSLETALTVLTIFSDQYQHRSDLLQLIKKEALDLPEIQKLEGLAQAKLLLFLSYNYETIYHKREAEAGKFLSRAANFLDLQSTLGACALLLFKSSIGLGFQKEIWQLLLDKIVNSKSTYLLQIIQKIIAEKIQSLSSDLVQGLVERIIIKLISEYTLCESSGARVKGSPALLKCLNLLQEISSHTLYLQKEQYLIDTLWPVFDMFQFASKIEFEDNIVSIFNGVLRGTNHLKSRHYSFVDVFPGFYERLGEFGSDLVSIFRQLLVRGREYFLLEGSRGDLENTLRSLKQCYNYAKQQKTLRYICIFYQFVYAQYTQLLEKDNDLLQYIHNTYSHTKQTLSQQTLAAIINLFITIEVLYGNSHHSIIQQNNISIFRSYQGQIAAQGFRKLIEKYYSEDSVIDYLRYSIRLLHYLKGIKQAASNDSPQKQEYYSLQFSGLQLLDPFQQTCKALNFLKDRLPAARYDSLIDNLNQQISLGDVRDLLTKRIVMRNLRTFVRVKNIRSD